MDADKKSRYKKIVTHPVAIDQLLVDHFIKFNPKPPAQIVLDVAATGDPPHGDQKERFFHG